MKFVLARRKIWLFIMLFTQQFFSVTPVIAADRTIDAPVTGSSPNSVAPPLVVPDSNSTLTITNTGSVTNTYNLNGNLSDQAYGSAVGTSYTLNLGTTINNSGIISGNIGVNTDRTSPVSSNNLYQNAVNNLLSGQIIGYQYGIYNNDYFVYIGYLSSITNGGSIVARYTPVSGDDAFKGSGIANFSTLRTLTNTGSISSTGPNIYNSRFYSETDSNQNPIYSTASSFIQTFNNAQGGSGASTKQTALTYYGDLPKNYNIIINSPTHYGQLSVLNPTNIMAFGIYNTSIVTVGTYKGVLQGFGNNLGTYISSGTTGTYGIYDWSFSQQGTSGIWDLVFQFTRSHIAYTQASLQQMATNLKGVYALQTSAINNGLSYDCTVFDKNGICISTGGRYTRVNTGDNSSNGLIIGAYKLNPQLRLGGYIDQNLSPSNLSPGIDLGNASPLFGVFGVWNDQADQLGYSVRVAAGYGDRDLSMTRQVIGTSEAGSGSTRLNSQAVSVEARYAMPMDPQWIATPYVGIRYTKINASAYTEKTTAAINNYPLSFNTLSQEYTTALAGLRVNGKVDSNFGIFAGAGIEQDLNNHGDNYSATGMTGLTAINLNPNLQKTRPVVNLGAFYDIDKTQRISFNAIYRQEAFQSTNTLTSLVTYTAGF